MDFPGFVLGPYGGHAWGARPRATALAGAASPLPARVVRDRSEGWAPRALDQEGWNSLETENAELRGSVPAPFLDRKSVV